MIFPSYSRFYYWISPLFGIFSILRNTEMNTLIYTSLSMGGKGIFNGTCILSKSVSRIQSPNRAPDVGLTLTPWLHPSLPPVFQGPFVVECCLHCGSLSPGDLRSCSGWHFPRERKSFEKFRAAEMYWRERGLLSFIPVNTQGQGVGNKSFFLLRSLKWKPSSCISVPELR